MWHDFVFSKGRSILGGPRVVILQALDFMGHPSLGGDCSDFSSYTGGTSPVEGWFKASMPLATDMYVMNPSYNRRYVCQFSYTTIWSTTLTLY